MKLTNKGLGYHSEEDIDNFTFEDCCDYLATSHTKKEILDTGTDNIKEMIKELEYNYQINSL